MAAVAVHTRLDVSLRLLKLIEPFTEEELKRSYRKLAHETHPDKGGTCDAFAKIQKAYETLVPFSIRVDGYQAEGNRTRHGHLLADLGKGLGELVNSWTCTACEGKGYIKVRHHAEGEFCPDCWGRGFKYSLRDHQLKKCGRCQGMGYLLYRASYTDVLHTCHKCEGTGQIRIPNPVLPKGRVPGEEKKHYRKTKKVYCECGALVRNGWCWKCRRMVGDGHVPIEEEKGAPVF